MSAVVTPVERAHIQETISEFIAHHTRQRYAVFVSKEVGEMYFYAGQSGQEQRDTSEYLVHIGKAQWVVQTPLRGCADA